MRVLGILVCLTALGLAGFSAYTFKAPRIQADIERRSAEALAALDAGAIDVRVDGRHVTLEGLVADDAARRELLEAVAAVPGALGPIDRLEQQTAVSPYRFEVVKDESGVTIRGHAPSEADKGAIENDAVSLFGDRASFDIEVADGAPSEDWTTAAVASLDALATLRAGRLSITDDEIRLEGEVSSDTDLDAIAIFAGMLPETFRWTQNVATAGGKAGGQADRQTAEGDQGDAPETTEAEADDADSAPEVVTPFTFSVVKETDGGLYLRGFAPDEATRGLLIDEGKAVSGDKPIVADIQIADGMPDREWPSLVQAGIAAMKDMEFGRFEVTDNDVSFMSDPDGTEAVGDAAGRTPAPDASDRISADSGVEAAAADDANVDAAATPADAEPADKPVPASDPILTVDKVEEGVWSVRGMVPDEAAEDKLVEAVRSHAEVDEVDVDLEISGAAADADWLRFAEDRIVTLDSVRAGRLHLEDGEAHLIGVVDGPEDIEPVRAELAAIDEGMTVDLQPIDPRPLATLDLTLSPGEGVTLNGALPEGLSEGEAMLALGIKRYDGALEENGRGAADAWREDLAEIGPLLAVFDQIDLSLGGERAEIKGQVHHHQNADAVARELVLALSDDSQPLVDVATSTATYDEGATRANPLTGEEEAYRQGYWLPVMDFAADEAACRERGARLLERNRITFLRGEADLDQRAEKTLNALAGLALACLETTNLVLEIGGHTDSRGAASMNRKLSQARADAVLNALAARGVDVDALSAVGYGDQQPVADNSTDEGRAANRRITFEWKASQTQARSGGEG